MYIRMYVRVYVCMQRGRRGRQNTDIMYVCMYVCPKHVLYTGLVLVYVCMYVGAAVPLTNLHVYIRTYIPCLCMPINDAFVNAVPILQG